MNLQTPFFVCSAPDEISLAHLLAFDGAKLCNGTYNGIPEQSVLIPLWGEDSRYAESIAQAVGYLAEQESVLLVDADRSAALLYCDDGTLQPCGRWREMQGKPSGDYTEIEGRYFQAGV